MSVYAHATQVYITIDQDGNRVFSDQPSNQAQIHTIRTTQTIPSIAIDAKTTATHEPADSAYRGLSITTPVNDLVLTPDLLGNLSVSGQLSTSLHAGDEAVLLLDQRETGSSAQLQWQLKNLDRGSHQLQIVVRERQSRSRKAQSPNIQIHVQRHRAQ